MSTALHRLRLDNGLTVLLLPQRTARVAALQLWVGLGSADETEEEAGLAHLHEHMLFKGTSRRGPGEIAREIETNGGEINAWTSYDQTVYHLVLGSESFDEGLDILADAACASVFDPQELEREIEVVLEEIRRADDMPLRRVSRELFSLAFERHPYRRPVIGYERTVRSFTRERILDFYRRFYVAQNMVLVAVGDFDPEEAADKVRRHFGALPAGSHIERTSRVPELPQTSPRARVVPAHVRDAYLSVGWHGPGVRAEDVPALDVLALVLGQGDSSRLTLEVKRDRSLVKEIHASAYTPRDPGLLIVAAATSTDRVPDALREALAQTYRLRREELSAEELSRAKRMLESDTVFQRETVQGQARKLGFFELVVGTAEDEERYLEAISRVTAADVRAVADRYLRTENLSLALLHPEDGETIDADALLDIAREVEAGLPTAIETRPAGEYRRLSVASNGAEPRPLWSEVLPNGVRLLVKEEPAVPLVSLRAAWIGGLRGETPDDNGVNHLLARSLMRGTEKLDARSLAQAIDELSGGISGSAGRNSFGLRGEFLSADIDRGFELFSDVLLRPSLPAAEVDKERALIHEEIRSRDDHPSSVAFRLFLSALYDSHPYRLETQGSEESLSRLDAAALHAFRRDRYRLDGLTLALTGDVSPERARELALRHLHGGLEGASPTPSPAVEPPLDGPRERRRQLPRKQAHLLVGFRGTTLTSPDRFALEVLTTVLSGQGGRLFLELRDKRSMAYSVTALSSDGLEPGWFAVYMGTSPEKVPAATDGIRQELERLRQERVTDAELDRARRHVVGTHEIGLQRLSARAGVLALETTYGLGPENHLLHADRIHAVTADDVLRVAQRYFDFDRQVTALVSPDA